MSVNNIPVRANFGLLPEPEGRSTSFITSAIINSILMALVIIIGMTVKHVVVPQQYEQTALIVPTTQSPEKVKPPEPPKVQLPVPPKISSEMNVAPLIEAPRPEPKPIQIEAKTVLPTMKAARPAVILAPQTKSALAYAAAPAQSYQAHPSTAPVHFGQTFGVTPNPNATRPANVAAIGNPYGGTRGAAVAPRGVVGSTGFGNGTRSGSNAGVVGRVASAAIPGTPHAASRGNTGRVASAGIPAAATAVATQRAASTPSTTNLVVLSKPPVQYTSEAKQLRVQGDVVLRVTFTASGHVVIQSVVRGLGHGLDEEARKVAQKIRFRPATRNGQAIDMTTNITITFQLA
jgi:TonB family protein